MADVEKHTGETRDPLKGGNTTSTAMLNFAPAKGLRTTTLKGFCGQLADMSAMQPTSENKLFSIHFAGTQNILEGLAQYRTQLTKKAFYEEYMDTKDHILTRNNYWLRRRWNFDGSFKEWSLKWPVDSSDGFVQFKNYFYLQYKETQERTQIIAQINKLMVQEGLPTLKSLKTFLESPVAIIPVIRHEIRRDDVFIYFDEARLGLNDYYIIGALQGKIPFKDPKDIEQIFEAELQLGPVRSKIIEYLVLHNKTLLEKLTSRVVPDLPYASDAFHRSKPVLASEKDFTPESSFEDSIKQSIINIEQMLEEEFGDEESDDDEIDWKSRPPQAIQYLDKHGKLVTVPPEH